MPKINIRDLDFLDDDDKLLSYEKFSKPSSKQEKEKKDKSDSKKHNVKEN